MKKKEYEQIVNDLQALINECKSCFYGIETIEDVLNCHLAKIINIKTSVKDIYDKMTKYLMVDFYHLITMGDLTQRQTPTIIRLTREYASYRPLVNAFKDKLKNLEDLPKIPVKTKYILKIAGRGIALTKGEGEEEVEDNVEVDTYDKIIEEKKEENLINKVANAGYTPEDASQVYKVVDNVVYIKSDKLKDFLEIVEKITGIKTDEVDRSKLRQRAGKGKDYFGFSWNKTPEDYFVMMPGNGEGSKTHFNKIMAYYNAVTRQID